MKPPVFRLDLAAVRHNVRAWSDYLAGRSLWAVVKSNAYGLGLKRVALACLEAGAQRLCVVDMKEARVLRASGIKAPIVHIWATPLDELEDAVALGVVATIEDVRGAKELSKIAQRRHLLATAHLAIETGTGWSGIFAYRAKAFAAAVRGLPGIKWEGAWTHIASREQMPFQMDEFNAAVEAMRRVGLPLRIQHVAATAPALWGVRGNAARIGVGLYGAKPGAGLAGPSLKTAVSLRATVVSTKEFERATALGYGGTSLAKPGDSIATLRLGYADGLPRALAGGGFVRIHGERCRIVGAIGMNFTMVTIPYGVTIAPGDSAIVLGDEDGLRIDDVANRASIIPHQLITSLSALSARRRV